MCRFDQWDGDGDRLTAARAALSGQGVSMMRETHAASTALRVNSNGTY